MVTPEAAPLPARRPGALDRVVSVVGWVVGVVAVAFVVRILVIEWPSVRSSLADADVALLVSAVVTCGVGMGWVGLQWSAVLRALGADRVPRPVVMRSYFIGQMGKYVPGGVWPVLGRAEMLARAEVPRRIAYASVGLSMVVTYAAALVLTAAAAPWALARLHLDHGWVVAVVPGALLLLHPHVLGRAIDLAARVSRSESVVAPAWRDSIVLVARHVPAWMLISLSTWLTGEAIGADVSPVAIAYATPLSWAAGLLAVPVPGGIGVREAVFLALLAGSADDAAIATVAILSRLAFVVADVIAALGASWSARRP